MAVVPASSRGTDLSQGGTITGPVRIVSTSTTDPVLLLDAPNGSGVPLLEALADDGEDAAYATGAGGFVFHSGSGTIGFAITDETIANRLDYRSAQGLRLYFGDALAHALLATTVGFFGKAPVAQPAAPTDTASIIAALQALGLVAP